MNKNIAIMILLMMLIPLNKQVVLAENFEYDLIKLYEEGEFEMGGVYWEKLPYKISRPGSVTVGGDFYSTLDNYYSYGNNSLLFSVKETRELMLYDFSKRELIRVGYGDKVCFNGKEFIAIDSRLKFKDANANVIAIDGKEENRSLKLNIPIEAFKPREGVSKPEVDFFANDVSDSVWTLFVNDVIYDGGKYFMTADLGVSSGRSGYIHSSFSISLLLISKDLINWEIANLPRTRKYFGEIEETYQSFTTIKSGNNKYLINGNYFYSDNGLDWKLFYQYPPGEYPKSNSLVEFNDDHRWGEFHVELTDKTPFMFDGDNFIYFHSNAGEILNSKYNNSHQILVSADGLHWEGVYSQAYDSGPSWDLPEKVHTRFICGNKYMRIISFEDSSLVGEDEGYLLFSNNGKDWDKLKVNYNNLLIMETDRDFLMYLGGYLWLGNPVYNDVPREHWAFKSIINLSSRRVISGYEGNIYKPNQEVTKAEYVKMIVTILTNQSYKKTSTHWASGYFDKAFELGIIQESNYEEYSYDSKLLREEMASIIGNTIKYMKRDSICNINKELSKINDGSDVSEMYKDEVALVINKGIIIGDENKNFKPKGNVSRAVAAKTVDMLLEREVKEWANSGR